MDASNHKILTFGGATQDVFLLGKALQARRDVRQHDYVEEFPLGAKIEVEQVVFDTGGGATNAAVTFARQGIATSYVGKVGHDVAGTEVLRVLRREGVGVEHVATDARLGTSYSTLLLAPTGERTILNYRGASHSLHASEMNIDRLRGSWFYITSLAGDLGLLEKLLKHAKKHNIKVALDPGADELAQAKKLRKLLPLVTVLKANAQELAQLFGGDDLRDTVTRATGTCPYVVGTNGPFGSYALHEDRLYQAGIYQKVKVTDRTGAGDAFGSGFVAALAREESIEAALSLGSANATGVVQQIGAKTGIVSVDRVRQMKVRVHQL